MKISLNVEADAISVTALNGGRIAVDMDGVAFTELIAVVNQYDDAEQSVTKNPVSPWARITGICCSIAHITSDDNACLGLIQGVVTMTGYTIRDMVTCCALMPVLSLFCS